MQTLITHLMTIHQKCQIKHVPALKWHQHPQPKKTTSQPLIRSLLSNQGLHVSTDAAAQDGVLVPALEYRDDAAATHSVCKLDDLKRQPAEVLIQKLQACHKLNKDSTVPWGNMQHTSVRVETQQPHFSQGHHQSASIRARVAALQPTAQIAN